MSKPFTEKVAIVTGGGTGLGKAISLHLADMGAHVVLVSRKEDNLSRTATEINELGGSADYEVANIRDPEQVNAFVDRIVARHGRIDILVNNAGGQFPALSKDISPNGWKSVVDLNLNAYFYCCKYVGNVMINQKSGNIVNMSAITALKGTRNFAHASAARAGTIKLTEALAIEWAEYGIRVNAIAPGLIETQGLREEFEHEPQELDRMLNSIPLKRFGAPEEVAKVVGFLTSDQSSYVTGQTITIDGGSYLAGGL